MPKSSENAELRNPYLAAELRSISFLKQRCHVGSTNDNSPKENNKTAN